MILGAVIIIIACTAMWGFVLYDATVRVRKARKVERDASPSCTRSGDWL